MNVYDIAHSLARAIKNSEEYKDYKKKRERVFADKNIKEMVLDFKKKAIEIQMQRMTGEEVPKERLEKFEKLEEIVMGNPIIYDFFMAEIRLGQMMNDIYEILGEAVNMNWGIRDNEK
ncbi:YlbF family regulator [Caloranaerobacter azorensis]|uniref:Cell fate regulator YlbF, YheA/YmcA/DUF963 family (Controls sporulation, competence, biofilm development) n=3 Tax=Caloranaerobacter azorensis TaxID=116090 RepID=A0A1M5RVU4_9FIRM|nr:YlbF family regulator [Caloranaerobacter azorensis]KGG81464.1 hypothetical protein Y919_00435 [Caloranaerobacter azorensis H53214]QIB26485.1 YlbF family regulator [Caloranaerobacter azorensis]SHH30158.1 Cell fate regulator YlbF, YheA/YmcA/DUF963 family (controls sporulation, competence, biofilm development) [Caloranaerobacter azorensis DSM 13643]